MATENEEKVTQLPTAKRHKILGEIASQLSGAEQSETVKLAGHTYLLTTLTADEENWSTAFVSIKNELSAITSIKLPKLAASIKEIDGVKVSDLFTFSEDTDRGSISYHTSTQYRKRYWEMQQMFIWLGERDENFVTELFRTYANMMEKRDVVWEELKK